MKKRSFVIRTVKDDGIKLDQCRWIPTPKVALNGRLDGKRYAFGRYYKFDSTGERPHTLLSLWGSEAYFRGETEGEDAANNAMIEDGIYLSWLWWRPEPCIEAIRKIVDAGGTRLKHYFEPYPVSVESSP
jgi:hypothetical protein